MWRRLHADGTEWEVRVVARSERESAGAPDPRTEMLEFCPLDGMRPPRRIAVHRASLTSMDDAALHAAYRQARPIGGDYYGRPGKWMSDMGHDRAA